MLLTVITAYKGVYMQTKHELKDLLSTISVLQNNEWLDKYVDLIFNNQQTKYIKGKTQSHHVIPACYFNHFDPDVNLLKYKNNRVNLLAQDHALAHCYLCLAAKESLFKYYMFMAIKYLMSCVALKLDDIQRVAFMDLSEVQQCYESCANIRITCNPMRIEASKKRHDIKMHSDEIRNKISNTLHNRYIKGELFTTQHRQKLKQSATKRVSKDGKNISNTGYVGGVTGLVMLYSPQGKRVYKKPEEVQQYLDMGYNRPVRKNALSVTPQHLIPKGQLHEHHYHISKQQLHDILSKAHIGKSPGNKGVPCKESTKQKIAQSIRGSKYMYKDQQQKMVKPNQFDYYLSLGFQFGRIR